MSRTKALYILSAGRSGSTLLDVTLSSAFDGLSAGELSENYDHCWRNNLICSCGQPVRICTVWSKLVPEIERKLGPIIGGWNNYEGERKRFERLRGLPYMFWCLSSKRPSLTRYQEATAAIFDAVAARFEKRLVVDSSKAFSRAVLLLTNKDLDAQAIWLIRSSLGVVASYKKSYKADKAKGIQNDIGSERPALVALRWSLANLLGLVLKAIFWRRVHILSYEKFCSAPDYVVETLKQKTGWSNNASSPIIAFPLCAHHMLAGNRLRTQTITEIRKDESWRSRLKWHEILIVYAITAPVNALNLAVRIVGN